MKIDKVVEKTNKGLPEKVLQIGEGNFLRAFADWMIDTANSAGVFDGSVVVCQPIARGMAEAINNQNGVYTLLMRGVENNEVVTRKHVVTSISRCINPYEDFASLMEIAVNPDLKVVISNTTEAGIAYHEGDKPDDKPPVSFPAKMTVILHERYKKFNGQQDKGLLMLPVELIDKNGDNLKNCILRYAKEWNFEEGFISWLENANCFANTLVDRIVTGYPKDEINEIWEKLGYEDDILVTSEPFHLWVIQAPEKWRNVIPLNKAGLHVVWTDDITPYRTRKVRILNGAHTVSVLAAYLSGHDIVLEMMKDEAFNKYLKECIWDEIIPQIPLPEDELDSFAKSVFERFSNPFIKHRLLDISLNSVSKFKARCLPSMLDYIKANNKLPKILPFGLAALIAFYRGTMEDGKYFGRRADGTYEIRDDAAVLEFFSKAWADPDTIAEKVLSNADFWGQDLTMVAGLSETVNKHLQAIIKNGVQSAMKEL
jgi:tagaturonate reductase